MELRDYLTDCLDCSRMAKNEHVGTSLEQIRGRYGFPGRASLIGRPPIGSHLIAGSRFLCPPSFVSHIKDDRLCHQAIA